MFYVFEHILLCLLAAALLGGLIAWLIRGMGFGSRLAETEADWRRKLGFADDERSKLAVQLKTSESRFAKLESDHGGLKVNFAEVSGKIPVLESAVAGWVAKSALWDTAKAKLEADLKACAAARSNLELQLADWTAKAKAWDTERADMSARANAAETNLQKAVAEQKATGVAYEKSLADLRAQLTASQAAFDKQAAGLRSELDALQRRFASSEAERDQFRASHEKVSTDHRSALAEIAALAGSAKLLQTERDKAMADHRASVAQLENSIHTLRGELASSQAHVESKEAERAGVQAELRAVQVERDGLEKTIVSLHANAGDLQSQLKALHAERDKAIADFRSGNAQLEDAIHKLRIELTAANNSRDKAAAEALELGTINTDLRAQLTATSQESNIWKTRFAELEASQPAPLAMAAAAGAGSVADQRYTKLEDRFHTFVVRTQKGGYGDIERIEGIGPVYGQKLRSIGIAWVAELLEEGASAPGRQRIVEESGIDRGLILTWVNHADLLRIDGVTPDWAELLEVSGVDTVKELRNRVPENLHRKMEEVNPTNPQGHYAPTVPDLEMVREWVEIAKRLPPKVTY